jgi:hypothetical protein
LLKSIIHDWDDESALKILRNCRHAIRPGGTLLLIETILGPSSEPQQALMDLLLMVLAMGPDRTEAEFRSILAQAGFSVTGVISIDGASIIECHPV